MKKAITIPCGITVGAAILVPLLFAKAATPNADGLLGHVDTAGTVYYSANGANNGPNPLGLVYPGGMAIDSVNHRLFVADNGNSRVLVFPLTAGNLIASTTPSYVLGQQNFYSNNASIAQGLNSAIGLAYDAQNSRLFVADDNNNRVVVYNVAPGTIANGESASYVLGQTSLSGAVATTTQSGLSFPGDLSYDASNTRLFVQDVNNNRVLVFNVATGTIANGELAANVLGQTSFTSSTASTSASGLNFQSSFGSILYDASNTRLFVSDTGNNRVLSFNLSTISNGKSASSVLGQASLSTGNFTSVATNTLEFPNGLSFDPVSNRLFVTDPGNDRLMVFNVGTSSVFTNGMNASNELGQVNFKTASNPGTATQNGFYTPDDSAYDPASQLLYVSDVSNQRVMIFPAATSTLANDENATSTIGHYDQNGNPVFTQGAQNNGPSAQGFYVPVGVALDTDNHRLFVADAINNRILVFALGTDDSLSTTTPSYVLGQSTFTTNGATSTQSGLSNPEEVAYDASTSRLFVADNSNNRVMVFNVAPGTIANGETAANVLGQSGFLTHGATTTASGFSGPLGLALQTSTNKLFIADSVNNRILAFNVASGTITNGESASNVLGQAGFFSSGSGTNATSTNFPEGISIDPSTNRLFAVDNTNNRVLIYDIASGTITNGESASNVLGQSGFLTHGATTTASGFYNPFDANVDPIRQLLFVADSSNNRIMVFNIATSTIMNGESAANVIGQSNFTSSNSSVSQSSVMGPNGVMFDSTHNRLFASLNTNAVVQFTLIHVTAPTLASGTVGTAYSQTITTASSQSSPTFKLVSGSLPSGLTLATTTGVIAGTPTVATTTTFTVEADDATSTGIFFDQAAFTLETDNPALSGITPTSTPPGTVGVAYSQILTATGGGAPYTWSVASGTFPSGLALATSSTAATTTISGTPTVATTTSVIIQVASGGASTTQSYTLSVIAPPEAPTSITAVPGNAQATITFTPSSTGNSPILYFTATANPGGASATSSASPVTVAGLTNGQLYSFTVTATNVAGTSASSSASNSVTPTATTTSATPSGIVAVVSQGSGAPPSNPPSNSPSTTASTAAGTTSPSYAALLQQLDSLRAQLAALEAPLFMRNLKFWMTGADVTALQQRLVSNAAGPAAAALGRHGTTITFGPLTFRALVEFQKSVGIPATGYFGPITRAYFASHPF